jgi:AcrR family transcriptional regulator
MRAEDGTSPARARVLQAAAAAICERGLADTRVADIAVHAGMSPGHVMYYFSTREEILVEALRWANERFLEEALAEAALLPTVHERLLRLVDLAMPSDPAEEPHSQWLLWLDVWARSPRNAVVDANRRDLESRWVTTYADLVEQGIAAGEFRAVDAQDFAVRFAVLMDGLGKAVVLADTWMSRERARRICADMIAAELVDESPAGRA